MNDVEHDEEAQSVSLVHHVLQVVGTAITRRGSEETCHLNGGKEIAKALATLTGYSGYPALDCL